MNDCVLNNYFFESGRMSEHLFFEVEGVSFKDLLDWSDPHLEAKKTKEGRVRGLGRQNSKTGRLVSVNEAKLALFRYGSDVFAIDDKCPHAGGPLHVGDIEALDESLCVRCPWHSWCFDLRTGKAKRPKQPQVRAFVYPVRVSENGKLQVGFEAFHPSVFTDIVD